jgi:hypothetical protein
MHRQSIPVVSVPISVYVPFCHILTVLSPSDDIEVLRKENDKLQVIGFALSYVRQLILNRLQHDLRETRKELAAAKGGYDIVDPKIVNQVPKGTSKLQPSVKQ